MLDYELDNVKYRIWLWRKM